jgi:hypothetical protein
MDEPSSQSWFLHKYQDGGVFGPLLFGQLARWASAARIAPHDAISTDQQERIRGLEQSLREERRALEETEQRYQELERKYQKLLKGRDD